MVCCLGNYLKIFTFGNVRILWIILLWAIIHNILTFSCVEIFNNLNTIIVFNSSMVAILGKWIFKAGGKKGRMHILNEKWDKMYRNIYLTAKLKYSDQK